MSAAGSLFKDNTKNTTLLLEVIFFSSCVEDSQILFILCELFITYTQDASRLYENVLIAVSKKAVVNKLIILNVCLLTEIYNVLWYDKRQPKVE